MGTLTNDGDVVTHALMQRGETVTVAISGTYSAIELQRATTRARLAWETLRLYNTADATEAEDYVVNKDSEFLRLFLRTNNSGSATVTLVDSDQVLSSVKDKQGNLVYEVTQAGIRFPKTVTVDGASTLTGNVAAAGTLGVTGIITAAAANVLNGVPSDELKALDASQKFTIFDDFEGDLLRHEWLLLNGSDAEALDPVIVAAQENGIVRLTSGDAGSDDDAVDVSILSTGLHFQPDKGGLAMEVNLDLNNILEASLFIGFTDQNTVDEMPLESAASADTMNGNAANAAGVGFDTDMSTLKWYHGGVNDGTETTTAFGATAPVNNTRVTVRVEISATGGVRGFIDGVAIGAEVASALQADTPLAAQVCIMPNSAATRLVDVDYFWAQQDR